MGGWPNVSRSGGGRTQVSVSPQVHGRSSMDGSVSVLCPHVGLSEYLDVWVWGFQVYGYWTVGVSVFPNREPMH